LVAFGFWVFTLVHKVVAVRAPLQPNSLNRFIETKIIGNHFS
jgi:predicted HicB family RNase H-like nuclease